MSNSWLRIIARDPMYVPPAAVREQVCAVLLAGSDRIDVGHLTFARSASRPEPAARPGAIAEDLSDEQRADRDRLVRALEDCGGNQSRAAKRLGISRTTMVTKLGLYRIRRPRS